MAFPWIPQVVGELDSSHKILGVNDFLMERGKGENRGSRMTHRDAGIG